jgi:hypothetical protein
MKNKNNWVILLLFLFPIISNAQTKELKSRVNTKSVNTNSTPSPVELDKIKTKKLFNDSINNQVSLINSHLNSIQIKWDWVMNNPEKKLIAEESKWFEDMTAIRAKLNARKKLLINSLKK